jgi:hypothetical protein
MIACECLVFLFSSRKSFILTFRVPIVLRVSLNDVDASSCRDKSVAVDPDAVVSSNPYCCL